MKNLPHPFFNFASRDVLCRTLARTVAAQLREALIDQDRATLIVSGGSTPLPMFRELCQQNLDWQRVHISLADERWVSEDHADSNTALVKKELLRGSAAAAHFIPLWNPAESLAEGVQRTNLLLAEYPQAFDVVILGMGNDGHTASLFPCANNQELDRGLQTDGQQEPCVPIGPSTAQHKRITMTLPRLLNSKHLILHTSGADKRSTLEKALAGNAIEEMPVRAFLQQRTVPMSLFWAP